MKISTALCHSERRPRSAESRLFLGVANDFPIVCFRADARGIGYLQVRTQTEPSQNPVEIEILRAWPDASICHGFVGRTGGVSTGAFASMNLSYWVGDDDCAVDSNWERLRREVLDL